MIYLVGHRGYIGSAFTKALVADCVRWMPFPSERIGGASFGDMIKILREGRPSLVINAAGFTGKPNVDECERKKDETIEGNLLLPVILASACVELGIPWGHVSSGCVYNGAKVEKGDGYDIVTDLQETKTRKLWTSNPPALLGFTEKDEPNFTFDSQRSSFYSGVKALAEKSLNEIGGGYIWRIRMPFDHLDHHRNYLTKLQTYPRLYDNINSLSHRGESAQTCLRIALGKAPFGIYNVVNPGFVSTRQIVGMLSQHLKVAGPFRFWKSDRDFYRKAAKARRSNCLLDTSKLDQIGLGMRTVEEALRESLQKWVPRQASGEGLACYTQPLAFEMEPSLLHLQFHESSRNL